MDVMSQYVHMSTYQPRWQLTSQRSRDCSGSLHAGILDILGKALPAMAMSQCRA